MARKASRALNWTGTALQRFPTTPRCPFSPLRASCWECPRGFLAHGRADVRVSGSQEPETPQGVAGIRPCERCPHDELDFKPAAGKTGRQSSRRKTKDFRSFPPLSFVSDLSHHRTCRSAYGGSLHSVQLNIVVHQARIASKSEFVVSGSVVHNAFRIGPISFATVPIDSRPVWFDATLD